MSFPSHDEADPGKLTFFKPPKDENTSNSSSVFQYVMNLFTPKKDPKLETDDSKDERSLVPSRPHVLELQNHSQPSRKQLRKSSSVSHNPGSEVELRLRSLSAILREVPKLVKGLQPDQGDQQSEEGSKQHELMSSGLASTELRQYWMPDEKCHECYDCGEKFTTFRRKHHCRICGQIFCSRCCNQLISGNIMGLPGMLRSCSYCWKFVSEFSEDNTPKSSINSFSHSSNAANMDAMVMEDSAVFGGVANDSMLSFGSAHPAVIASQSIVQSDSNTSLKKTGQASAAPRHETPTADDEYFIRGPYETLHPSSLLSPAKENSSWKTPGYIFDATPEVLMPDMIGNDIKDDLVKDSTQLHLLWRKISDEKDGVEFRAHRFRLRKYSNCVTGQELIDWLIGNDVASTRAQGCAIGQALYEGKWLKPVVDVDGVFQDGYVLFQSGNRPTSSGKGNRIEIYPDHFSNFPEEGAPGLLQTMTGREPIWVQEIKCGNEEGSGGDEEACRYRDESSESELTWSDAPNTLNEALLYSDEERSVSGRSVLSFSSFVEIDEGNDVIKYTRPSSPNKFSRALLQQSSSQSFQPEFDDSCLTSISADYLRNLLAWNGTCLSQPLVKPSPGWRESDLHSVSVETQDKRAFQWLREMYLRHNLTFLKQLLRDKGLDLSWAEVLVPLAKHAAQYITPNPNVNMDVCHYFQIKKVPDGPRNESEILNGVVCTKNVVHKQMKTDITNPSILLLAIPLEYQRVQLKLSALDPIVRQEREFYKHLISRITARKPKVVLVQCSVSHLAQELLLEAGITLVINVKKSVMERVARSTEGDVVYSIDQLIQAKLGRCSRFYTKHHHIPVQHFHKGNTNSNHKVKTLMYFDGCNPKYGCTAILRGRNDDVPIYRETSTELADVQIIFRFLVRAMFHARLELSYLIDQYNFGKLLKRNSSKQIQKCRTESESTAKNSENESECPDEAFEDKAGGSKKLKNVVEHLNSVSADSDNETSTPHSKCSVSATQKLTPIPFDSPDGGRRSIDVHPSSPSPDVNRFQFEEALKLILLSISPLVQPQPPFLLTAQGQKSPVRKFLHSKLFWSQAFETKSPRLQKFSSVVDMEHRGAIRSRSSTMESLVPQERVWLTPPHQSFKSVHSTDVDETLASGPASDSSIGSREILDEGVAHHILKKEVPGSHATCYSQQYKSPSDGPMQLKASAKLHTWEQRVLDMIFGPPMFLRNEKRERFVLSPEYSPNDSPSAKRRRPFTFVNELHSTRTSDVAISVKHDAENPVGDEDVPRTLHSFISSSLSEPASSDEVQNLLANFRAHAGLPDPKPEVQPFHSKRGNSTFFDNASDDEPLTAKLLPPDCMDPASHQHICALFSSYSPQSPNAPHFCVLPWVVDIDFYHGNDITLGGFLERYCFRPSYHCPSATCRRPMVEHIRSFVHGNKCMTVVLKELSKPFQQSCIMTWSWDSVTRKSSDIKTLSHDTWSMSFAKYLELNMGRLAIPDCDSSLQYQKGLLKQDIFGEEWELKSSESFQYFLFRDIVAAFKCFPITVKEVSFPSFKLIDVNADTAAEMYQISDEFYDDILTYTNFFSIVETLEERISETIETIQDYIQTSCTSKYMSENQSDEMLTAREKFYSDLTSSLAKEKTQLLGELEHLKHLLKSSSCQHSSPDQSKNSVDDPWDEDRLELDDPPLPKDLAGEISIKILHVKCKLSEMVQCWNEKFAEAHEKDRSASWTPGRQQKTAVSPPLQNRGQQGSTGAETVNPPPAFHLGDLTEEDDDSVSSAKIQSDCESLSVREQNPLKIKRAVVDTRSVDRPSYKRLSRTGSSVKFLARFLPGSALLPTMPMPFPPDEHFLLPECLNTNIVVRDAEPSSIIAYTLSSSNYKAALAELASSSENTVDVTSALLDVESRHEPVGVSSDASGDCGKADQGKSVLEVENPILKSVLDSAESEDSREASVASVQSSNSSSASNSPHVEIQFSDATTCFYCKVYFATLFETFRSKVLEGGEAQYLKSLSRSVKWLARGGKSGSTFHKTKDDQFILKQMSYFELQSFLEFAPKYVDYITNSIDNQEATTISKIVGVYRISFRNSGTSRSLKQDVLVIENLFYRKRIKQIFDLKGSVRNRHVKENTTRESTDVSNHFDRGDIVLQDANLLKMMCEKPIYVHEHTKHLLMSAVIRDAEFLSRNLVMDYSLLVGIEDDNQIIVGVIDFIRTFTWDKKLEMVVKWSSSRSMPTVVSPELYKNRFCEAMGRYFQVVPDRWYGMLAY